jgi:polyisoprenoid-binding protein YceI
VQKKVELKGELLGQTVDPWGNDRIAFEAQTSLNRKDFGLTWNQILETGGLLVGEKVEIVIELQLVRTGE